MENHMKKINLFERFAILLFIILFPFQTFSREKITVAVLDFEAKNVAQSSTEAVTDLLRTELFNTGHFKVIERQKIKKIVEEQRFQMSGLTDSDQVVEIGRLLNVQKIMIGTVTRLGDTHIINTRIVDVRSGLVVLAEAVESRGGEEMLPGAIAELAMTISYKVGLEGSVIRLGEDEVYIDLGKVDGIKLGQRFEVLRLGEPITDLEGHIIGMSDETIGTVAITKVQDRFAIAGIEDQSSNFKKGDKVKPILEETKSVIIKSEPKPKPKPKKQKKKKQTVEEDEQPDIPAIF
jgi:TolB-like protein